MRPGLSKSDAECQVAAVPATSPFIGWALSSAERFVREFPPASPASVEVARTAFYLRLLSAVFSHLGTSRK